MHKHAQIDTRALTNTQAHTHTSRRTDLKLSVRLKKDIYRNLIKANETFYIEANELKIDWNHITDTQIHAHSYIHIQIQMCMATITISSYTLQI